MAVGRDAMLAKRRAQQEWFQEHLAIGSARRVVWARVGPEKYVQLTAYEV